MVDDIRPGQLSCPLEQSSPTVPLCLLVLMEMHLREDSRELENFASE